MRSSCAKHGALLIFDEVMSGFRVALGGAQALYGVAPDLTILGKVIGGGLPVAAFGGRRDVMACLSPEGAVYQAGTLSGNPVAVACGLATLDAVAAPGFHERLGASTRTLADGLAAAAAGSRHRTRRGRGRWHVRVLLHRATAAGAGRTSAGRTSSDSSASSNAMLDRGVYLAPSAYEAGFVSSAHDGGGDRRGPLARRARGLRSRPLTVGKRRNENQSSAKRASPAQRTRMKLVLSAV